MVSSIVVQKDVHTAAAMVASGAWAYAANDAPLTPLLSHREDREPAAVASVTIVTHPKAEMNAKRRERGLKPISEKE